MLGVRRRGFSSTLSATPAALVMIPRAATFPNDTTPNDFTFIAQTNVALGATITSAAITVSGINAAATITVSGGTYDINGSGNFTSASGTVVNGDTVRARHTSSASNATATNTVVTIGGVSGTFTSTTIAADGEGDGLPLLFSDDFESGSMNHTENGISYGSSANVTVSTSNSNGGTRSARFAFLGVPSGQDDGAEQRIDLGAVYSQVYIAWDQYMPNGLESYGGAAFVIRSESPSNNKQLRLWRGPKSDGNDGYSSFYNKFGCSTDQGSVAQLYGEYGVNAGGVGRNGSTGTGGTAPTINPYFSTSDRGVWTRFGFYAKANTTSNNGIIRIYKNGTLVGSGTNLNGQPSTPSNAGFDFCYLLGYANSGFTNTTYIFIDNLKIYGVA